MTKTLLKYVLTVIVLLTTINSYGQDSLFRKQYLPEGYAVSSSLKSIKTNDGNFIIGVTCKDISAVADVWNNPVLIKLSEGGDIIWSFSYERAYNHYYFNDVAELSNGDLILAGNYLDVNNMGRMFVMKISANGTKIIWQHHYSNIEVVGTCKVAIGNNDEIWVGNTIVTNSKGYETVIIKYNLDGSYESIKNYGEIDDDYLHDIIVNNSNNLVIATEVEGRNAPGRDIALTEVHNSTGWIQNFGYIALDGYFLRNISIIQDVDNRYYLCFTGNGIHYGGGPPPKEFIMAAKTDVKFNLIWSTPSFKTEIQNSRYTITKLSNGHVVLYGSVFLDLGAGSGKGNIILPLSDGDFQIGHFTHESLVDQTSSGGSILQHDNNFAYYVGLKSEHTSPNTSYITFRNFSSDYEFCEKPSKLVNKQNIGKLYSQFGFKYATGTLSDITRGSTNFSPIAINFTNTTECITYSYNCAKSLSLEDSAYCNTEELTLKSEIKGYHYLWSTGDTTDSITVTTSGQYSLKAFVNPTYGCDTLYDTADIKLSPPIHFKMMGDIKADAYDEVSFSVAGMPHYTYTWYMGDGDIKAGEAIKHTYKKTGKYYVLLEVADTNNCTLTDSLEITIKGFTYYLPNAITPNNDGRNDFFEPIGVGIKYYHLMVYNRWGELLYNGENNGWDGTYKGVTVTDGEYTYLLTLQNDDLSKVNLTGKIYVVK